MKIITLSKIFLSVSLVCLGSDVAYSHSGGTNAAGCHTNRSTGNYHCHNSKSYVTDRVNYCHVIRGERRCGYALSSCKGLVYDFGGKCEKQ